MAICALILPAFVSRPFICLPLGTICITVGVWLGRHTFEAGGLFWLGFRSQNGFLGGDFYPILPWLGVALWGVFLTTILIAKGAQWQPENRFWNSILFIGRNSLVAYIVHQPILILIVLCGENLVRIFS